MTPTWVQKLLTEFGKITPSHLEDNEVADQLKTVNFFLNKLYVLEQLYVHCKIE